MNWKECGRKSSWPCTRNYSRIYLAEISRKVTFYMQIRCAYKNEVSEECKDEINTNPQIPCLFFHYSKQYISSFLFHITTDKNENNCDQLYLKFFHSRIPFINILTRPHLQWASWNVKVKKSQQLLKVCIFHQTHTLGFVEKQWASTLSSGKP
jgi:hypothetical protein